MKERDDKLIDRLLSMADDLQIGGDVCFRGMANAVKLRAGELLPEERAHIMRLLRRADNFLKVLHDFWGDNPGLDELVDRGAVLASDGLQYAEKKM